MQYIPCNSALLAQHTLFQKSTFLPKVFQKVRKSRQILISRQSSVCWCLKFLYKSKLFGEGPFCLHTTSGTLGLTLTILSFLQLAQIEVYIIQLWCPWQESCQNHNCDSSPFRLFMGGAHIRDIRYPTQWMVGFNIFFHLPCSIGGSFSAVFGPKYWRCFCLHSLYR